MKSKDASCKQNRSAVAKRAVVVKNCAFASLQLADEALVLWWCPGALVPWLWWWWEAARSSKSLQNTFTGSTTDNKQAIKIEKEGEVQIFASLQLADEAVPWCPGAVVVVGGEIFTKPP